MFDVKILSQKLYWTLETPNKKRWTYEETKTEKGSESPWVLDAFCCLEVLAVWKKKQQMNFAGLADLYVIWA